MPHRVDFTHEGAITIEHPRPAASTVQALPATRTTGSMVWAVVAAVLYAALMAGLYPYRDGFAFDPDEGFVAMRALMLDRGYTL